MGKKLKDLTLKDNFIFGAVMAEEENCRKLLELITEIPIQKVNVSREKSIVYHPEYKGVRLDVYAKDEKNTCYDVEMQVVRRSALGKRARFYRSQMDMEMLLKGRSYTELPDSYVIFICDFDPFERGYYRYSFKNLCNENQFKELGDGCSCIFLNTVGNRPEFVPESLVRFLQYLHADLQESEKDFHDPFIEQLQRTVKNVKKSREMEERYMIFEEMLRDEKAEGKAEGKADAVIGLLREKGSVSALLQEQIYSQKDLDILQDWISLAAKADSVQEFREKIQK